MRKIVVLLAILLATTTAALAQAAIGTKLDNFTLTDLDGKAKTLADLRGKNGTLLIWVSAQCPVVKAYDSRMNEVAAMFAAKGVNVIGVNSNATESLEWVKSDAAARWKFPVLLDKGAVLADKLGATVTPEVYYIDAGDVLLYQGAIDNDRSGSNITQPYLKTAFESVQAGKKIERASAKAFGCSIKKTAQ